MLVQHTFEKVCIFQHTVQGNTSAYPSVVRQSRHNESMAIVGWCVFIMPALSDIDTNVYVSGCVRSYPIGCDIERPKREYGSSFLEAAPFVQLRRCVYLTAVWNVQLHLSATTDDPTKIEDKFNPIQISPPRDQQLHAQVSSHQARWTKQLPQRNDEWR